MIRLIETVKDKDGDTSIISVTYDTGGVTVTKQTPEQVSETLTFTHDEANVMFKLLSFARPGYKI